MIESLRHSVKNLRNPFTDLYHWVKGEIYDLSAFTCAVVELRNISSSVDSLKRKIESSKADIDNI